MNFPKTLGFNDVVTVFLMFGRSVCKVDLLRLRGYDIFSNVVILQVEGYIMRFIYKRKFNFPSSETDAAIKLDYCHRNG